MTVAVTQKITTFLWFNQEAEEAANLYVSLFNGGESCQTLRQATGLR